MLKTDELETLRTQIQFINQNQAPKFYINEYAVRLVVVALLINTVLTVCLLDQVYEPIGAGAFGRVFKVKKKDTNHFLAMKEINSCSSSNDKKIVDVINEVTIIRNRLKHPNIVKYLKTFKENDTLYIVMEVRNYKLIYSIEFLQPVHYHFAPYSL